MKKSYLVAIVIVILAGIAVFALSKNKQVAKNNSENKQTGQTQQPVTVEPSKVTAVDFKEVPKGFPTDFPFEKNARIIQNYFSEGQGSVQYTRQFLSAKTLAVNFSLYVNYLSTKGWIISSKLDQPDVKIISATDGGKKTISITASPDPVTKLNLINVNLLEKSN